MGVKMGGGGGRVGLHVPKESGISRRGNQKRRGGGLIHLSTLCFEKKKLSLSFFVFSFLTCVGS